MCIRDRDYLPDRAEHGGMLALHYSHFELAFLSGMSERSVNRVLKRLKEEKLVTIGRKRVLIWPKAVSYTHLDVYKRQGQL